MYIVEGMGVEEYCYIVAVVGIILDESLVARLCDATILSFEYRRGGKLKVYSSRVAVLSDAFENRLLVQLVGSACEKLIVRYRSIHR